MRSFISIQLFFVASFVFLLNINESVAPDGGDDSGAVNAESSDDLGGRVSVDHEGGHIRIVDHVGGRVHEGQHEGGLKDVVDNGAPKAKTKSGKAAGRNDRNGTA